MVIIYKALNIRLSGYYMFQYQAFKRYITFYEDIVNMLHVDELPEKVQGPEANSLFWKPSCPHFTRTPMYLK